MSMAIKAVPLTAQAFAPFGQVIEKSNASTSFAINRGRCQRYHDIAQAEICGDGAHVSIGIAQSESYELPLSLDMVERHPLGSQTFMPLAACRFLVVVCADQDGVPGTPNAFLASGGQGVNYAQNTWHGVLMPLEKNCDFLIVDRAGPGVNLAEHFFTKPYFIDI